MSSNTSARASAVRCRLSCGGDPKNACGGSRPREGGGQGKDRGSSSNQPIERPQRPLDLDATFMDARWARKVENVSAAGGGDRLRLLCITIGGTSRKPAGPSS